MSIEIIIILNDKLESRWNESVMAYFKVVSQRLHRGSEENNDKYDNEWPVDPSPKPSDYETRC
jgi:hypothetical protein